MLPQNYQVDGLTMIVNVLTEVKESRTGAPLKNYLKISKITATLGLDVSR